MRTSSSSASERGSCTLANGPAIATIIATSPCMQKFTLVKVMLCLQWSVHCCLCVRNVCFVFIYVWIRA